MDATAALRIFTPLPAAWVESLVRLLPVKHAASLTGLHWYIIKNIDYRRLRREVHEPQRHRLRRLMMDEFAKVTVTPPSWRMLIHSRCCGWAKAFRPFFTWLGSEGCAAIESVAMDMNTAFDLEVREHRPQAQVVYDLFHVVAKFGREVIASTEHRLNTSVLEGMNNKSRC